MNLYSLLGKPTKLFDSHCHLISSEFSEDIDEVIERAEQGGVSKIIDIGIDIETSKKAIKHAEKYKIVEAAVGIDPQVFIPGNSEFINLEKLNMKEDEWFEKARNDLRRLFEAYRNQVALIGESGMDFHWTKIGLEKKQMNSAEVKQSHERQERLFRIHLELGEEFELPLSIHSRGAEKECLEIVKEYPNSKGIFHSFTGDLETAKGIIQAGWGLGVNGIITFTNATELQEMYRSLIKSLDLGFSDEDKRRKTKDSQNTIISELYQSGIYFETDAPYLAPDGKRGERNEPGNLRVVYERFLELV